MVDYMLGGLVCYYKGPSTQVRLSQTLRAVEDGPHAITGRL